MSLLRKTVFGRAKLKQNTFIGGMASILSTPALLATRLGINEQRIKLFEIRGNDIRCCIEGEYSIPTGTFRGDVPEVQPITYFQDKGVANLNGSTLAFRKCLSLKYVDIPNATSISYATFDQCSVIRFLRLPKLIYFALSGTDDSLMFRDVVNCKLYFPSATSLGSPNLKDGFFNRVKNSTIYIHPSQQTCNAGAPNPDLIFDPSLNNTVVYVQNQIAPERITDLSIGLKTSTTAQILFTNPTSTNTLQEFEVSIDAIPYQTITASGQYITGLTSGVEYKNVTVKAIDIYYNRAEESNQITFTTL